MFLHDNDFLLVVFNASSTLASRFDWPIYLADSKRVGHDKRQRKMLITRENYKIKEE